MNESNLEMRLANCSSRMLEQLEIIREYLKEQHIIDINKLIEISGNVHQLNIDENIIQCENTKRAIDELIKLLNLERRRRVVTISLNDATTAREKKTNIKNHSRMMRRRQLNPYGLGSIQKDHMD